MAEDRIPFAKPALPDWEEIAGDVERMVREGRLTKGEHVAALEEEAASQLGVAHAVGVASGTSGLMLVAAALGLEGEIVAPSFTFLAAGGAVVWAGLSPVFAEVDPRTMNLDPASAEAAITTRTSAILAVHSYGNPADVEALGALAEARGLKLIYDGAQAFGARWNSAPLGGQGDAHVFSLSPSKILVAGEGGLVTTNDPALAGAVRALREYGNAGGYTSPAAGLNARLPEFGALLARRGLPRVEEAAERRAAIAELYRSGLDGLPGVSFQETQGHGRPSYTYFPIFVDADAAGITRDALGEALAGDGIDTRRYYYPPLHALEAYASFRRSGDLVLTERLASQVLCLPIWSRMEKATVRRVCEAIARAFKAGQEIPAARE